MRTGPGSWSRPQWTPAPGRRSGLAHDAHIHDGAQQWRQGQGFFSGQRTQRGMMARCGLPRLPRGDQAGTGPTIRMTDKAGVGNAGRA